MKAVSCKIPQRVNLSVRQVYLNDFNHAGDDKNHILRYHHVLSLQDIIRGMQTSKIDENSRVADIVAMDYRTAEVFRKYGITYCCGGKYPLEMACRMHNIDPHQLQTELTQAMRTLSLPNTTDFAKWETNFLVDYLLNVHHHYLDKTLPETSNLVKDFIVEHLSKYAYLEKLGNQFNQLARLLRMAMKKEEEEIFPYIRQIVHAHKHKEPYAGLFIRTLRKPVEEAMFKGHEMINEILLSVRELTNMYAPPEKACLNHKVVLSKLKELDDDITQHNFLEEAILFPRVLEMERDLLSPNPKQNLP